MEAPNLKEGADYRRLRGVQQPRMINSMPNSGAQRVLTVVNISARIPVTEHIKLGVGVTAELE
jgi:hypothetical protein